MILKLKIVRRTKERFVFQEVTRQRNLEKVIEKSTGYLNETVDEKPVDEDWRTKFFNKVQDISSSEMQDIWARILAKEVSNSGSVSLRTLDIVSNLSKTEAEIFERAASLTFLGGPILIINPEHSFTEFGLSFADILVLRGAGLIHESVLTYTFSKLEEDSAIMVFREKFILIRKEGQSKFVFDQIAFTPVGRELLNIISTVPNYSYLEKFIQLKTQEGYDFNYLN